MHVLGEIKKKTPEIPTLTTLTPIHKPFGLRCRIKGKLHEFFNMDKDLTEEDYKKVSAFAFANFADFAKKETP